MLLARNDNGRATLTAPLALCRAALGGRLDLEHDRVDGGASTLGLLRLAASTELSYWRTRPVGGFEVAVGVLADPTDAAPSPLGPRPVAADTAAALLRLRLATLLAAQLFDFGTFVVMIARHGALAESNPLVAQGLAAYGLPLLAVAKVALVLLLGSIVVILESPGQRRPLAMRLATSVTLLAVAGGLLGGISNVLVLLG